jgi:hypothetical protein
LIHAQNHARGENVLAAAAAAAEAPKTLSLDEINIPLCGGHACSGGEGYTLHYTAYLSLASCSNSSSSIFSCRSIETIKF